MCVCVCTGTWACMTSILGDIKITLRGCMKRIKYNFWGEGNADIFCNWGEPGKEGERREVWHQECGGMEQQKWGAWQLDKRTTMGILFELLGGRLDQDICCKTKYLIFKSHEGVTLLSSKVSTAESPVTCPVCKSFLCYHLDAPGGYL